MAQNYVLLERIELNATAASVTFSNIPQTGYTDLKIVYSARSDAATTDRGMFVRFNGDTGSNYTYKFVRGDGSAAGSGGTTTTFLYFGNFDAATSTSNTFGNGEFYIPNYTSSTQKSVSSDSVSENNATSAWTTLAAGLWSGTSAISTILLYPEGGSFVSGSTFSLYGIADVNTTPAIAPKADGGNVIATDGTYWYHAFLSNGTFTPQVGLNADVLVVAGGGGGGTTGGGGGAGGLLGFTAQSLVSGTGYTCTVGAGGAASTQGVGSQFAALTATVGGGRGGDTNVNNAGSGGSGGGGGRGGTQPGGAGTSGQGNAGGSSQAGGSQPAGGGGGAGAVGANGSGTQSGAGGNGLSTYSSWGAATATGQNIAGTYWYAGGGGGAGDNGTLIQGAGGNGGGAAGDYNGYVNGTPNTGGGGGGGHARAGSSGGSGIIIIRYAA